MNTDLMQRIRKYLDSHKKKKRFIMSACALSLCTVLLVYGVLLQPAISMERKQLILTAEPDKGAYGDALTAEVTAMAKPGQPETYFLISEKGDGAAFADDLMFEDEIAVMELQDGTEVDIHREVNNDGEDAQYWFSLEEGQEAEFVLEYISDEYGSADVGESVEKEPVKDAGAAGSSEIGSMAETTEAEVIESAEAEATEAATTAAEVETTVVETTVVETAEVETAEAETTEVETAEIETTEVDATEVETTEVETTEKETTEIETSEVVTEESTAEISEHLIEMVRAAAENEATERVDEATPSDAEKPSLGSSSGTETEEEFTDKLTMKLRYSWGDSLDECRKNLKAGDELVLTWMSLEDLCKEGIASINIETDADEAESGDVITAIVSASLTEEAENEKIVSLIVNFDQAGLSDEYEFDGGVCELFDMAGEPILLHRQRTEKNYVYQYWFTLQPGQETEFELIFTEREEEAGFDEEFPDATASDASASDALRAVDVMALGEEDEADIEDMGELSVATPADAALGEGSGDELLDANGNELVISGELELYAGVGSTRKLSGKNALSKVPVYLAWYGEGTYILTCTLEDGVKVILTAPSGAFPEAEKLELSVKKLEGEDAEKAQVILDQQLVEENYRLQTIGLWDITVLDNGNEVQPQKPVSVTFENLQEDGIEMAPKILHLDHENAQAVDMNAALDANGQVVMEADGFSPYAVVRAVDIGKPSGSLESIPSVEPKSADDYSPNNGLMIEDIDGKAEFIGKPESVRTGYHTDGKPYYREVKYNPNEDPNGKPDKTSGNLWGGNWSETIWNPYKSFNQRYGALAVQFKGSNEKNQGYAMNYEVGWDQRDLSLETTTMKVKVRYAEVGTYNGRPIGADAVIKVTPSKNRGGNNGSWELGDYGNYSYNPTIQISRSLYSGWVWQNVKEFHVDLTFYYLEENDEFGEQVILNNLDEDANLDYENITADYYTINSLNPTVVAGDHQRYGPEYVLPDDAQNIQAYSIRNKNWGDGGDSHIVYDYPFTDQIVTGYPKQYAYNGGTSTWVGDDPEHIEWKRNSVMIMPAKKTGTIGFTLGSLMREPNKTNQRVPRTSHMWATISSEPIGVERPQPERTSVDVTKVWTDGNVNHENDSVIVRLFADGVDTRRYLVLNSDNNWKGTFDNLSVYQGDDTTRPKIVYSVLEDEVPGYMTSYDYISQTPDVWVPVKAFEEGETYAVVYDARKALRSTGGNNLSSTNEGVEKGVGEISIGDTVYTDYLTAVPDNAQWTASATGAKAKLKNNLSVSAKYIRYSGSRKSFISDKSGSDLTYDEERTLCTYDDGKKRYMDSENASTGATTNKKDATIYTLYKKGKLSVRLSAVITNRPINEGGPVDPLKPDLEHFKTIDYLGDKGKNPDTKVEGDDLYRLYLDMTGDHEPIDLLIVVDRSGSMKEADMGNGVRRDEAVKTVLNGSITEDGLISTFMSINPENQYAVISFQGNYYDYGYNVKGPQGGKDSANKDGGNKRGWKQDSGYRYNNDDIDGDSSLLQNWSSTAVKINNLGCKDKDGESHGTNYEAGLLRAAEMMNDPAVKNNKHRKVMIFLSDGVPTFYIIDSIDQNNDDNKNYKDRWNRSTIGTIGDRWGNGGADGTGGSSASENNRHCVLPSKDAFLALRNTCKAATGIDLTTYTIAITPGFGDGGPEVLKYMAEKGGGRCLEVTSTEELNEEFRSIFFPRTVTITDKLSKYTSWYGEQPDAKVTMTSKTNPNDSKVLYEGNHVTKEGLGILQDVVYSPDDSEDSTGTVQAIFEPRYDLNYGYTYTLSFNVKVTDKAYAEYDQNLSGENNGYPHIGDPETDYKENITSSDKPGFHSNLLATVKYLANGHGYEDEYDHPVIQVRTASLNVLKTSAGTDTENKPLQGVTFALYRAKIADDGTWSKAEDVPLRSGTTDEKGNLSLPGLRSGSYLLYETKAAPGFDLPDKPWHLTVNGSDLTLTTSDDPPVELIPGKETAELVFNITNQEAYQLPSTGGIGTNRYITGGIFMMIFAGLLYIYTKKRREGSTPQAQ